MVTFNDLFRGCMNAQRLLAERYGFCLRVSESQTRQEFQTLATGGDICPLMATLLSPPVEIFSHGHREILSRRQAVPMGLINGGI